MRQILAKHRPQKADEFKQWWENAGWGLEPLALALIELAGDGTVLEDELLGGDALARMAYRAGRRTAYLDVLDMLPPSAVPADRRIFQEIPEVGETFCEKCCILAGRVKETFKLHTYRRPAGKRSQERSSYL